MTRRAAVLGHPISHSKSPALHSSAYAKLGVTIDYSAIDVTVGGLPGFMASIREDSSWCGLSVTMPLKSAMVAEVDEVRGPAAALGVINTVVFENDGGSVRRVGYNTDVAGIVEAVTYAGVASTNHAAILGGGGTSAAAVAAAKELGARSVHVFVRDPRRATDAEAAASAVGISLTVRPLSEAAAAIAGQELVISTFPPRAADELADELASLSASGSGVLLDVAYDPWPSRLADVWQGQGGVVVPGLEMLMYQAAEQIRRFSGCDVDAAVIDVMCDSVGLPRRVF
ncbi:NAD(P)-binding domain-containing protein [Paenarthrobacter ilicis]|uniref:shikimate dehydrogenase family protein n=1 Tax=Paenarthrobacter ilicis TaxID=43665 RepID=UPI0028D01D77|nr:NAD(P)-binding domain-containing protein [Paenarthrobacter ilicis]